MIQQPTEGALPQRRPGSSETGRFRTRLRSIQPTDDLDAITAVVPTVPLSGQDYRDQVGRRLMLARKARGLGQERVAELAGLTRNWVSAVERGAITLDAWRLRQLAAALDVSTAWVLGLPEATGATPR